MPRKSFNRKDRARIFNAALGVCHLCAGKIGVAEAWEIEHVIPWALTHDDTDGNLRPAHVKCHRKKTDQDVTAIAKVYRIAAKHDGSWPPSRAKLPSRPFANSRSRS